jgi:hypothetical protein
MNESYKPTPSSDMVGYQRFGGPCCHPEDEGSMDL